MRPAMASLVTGGSIIWPSACRDTSRWVIRNAATAVKLSGTWSPRMTKARSARVAAAAAAWVARVWLASSKPGSREAGKPGSREAGQPGAAGVLLVVGAVARPGGRGVGGTDGGEQCGEGVGFADGDQVGAVEVFGFGGDAQAAGGTGQGHRSLQAGADDLEGGGTVRLAQRAGHQERPAPDRRGVAHPAGDDGGGQAPEGAVSGVQEPGAPGQRRGVCIGGHPQPVSGGVPGRVQDLHLGG